MRGERSENVFQAEVNAQCLTDLDEEGDNLDTCSHEGPEEKIDFKKGAQ